MGKRNEKSVKGGGPSSASSRHGDDCSTPEPYSCTGNFADDFTELWQRSGLNRNHVPIVRARGKRPGTPQVEDAKPSQDDEDGEGLPVEPTPTSYSTVDNIEMLRPNVQVDFELEETKQLQINHAKEIFIRSWKIEEKAVGVLKLCLLDRLQGINLWNVGLTDASMKSLASFLPSLPAIKSLVLDGNPIPDTEPFHLLVAGDCPLQHLSLKNNQITDKGVELIARNLGMVSSQSKCISSLNLSFNRIGDKGAEDLAKALRMNRLLLSLSLSSNHISDAGCKALAHVLQRFPLTHEEVVQRRKLISQQGYYGRGTSAPGSRRGESKDRPNSNRSGSQMTTTARVNRGSSKKKPETKKAELPEKTPKKEDRSKKVSTVTEPPKGAKGKKSGGGGKEGNKRATTLSTPMDTDVVDLPEFVHPLTDPHTEHAAGKVFVPGCMTLVNLNLSRNQIGFGGMEAMWAAVQYQSSRHRLFLATPSAPGLLKINLHKNSFPEDHSTHLKIQEAMVSRDPAYKPDIKTPDDDMQSVMS